MKKGVTGSVMADRKHAGRVDLSAIYAETRPTPQ
jgi:hypothetical protein